MIERIREQQARENLLAAVIIGFLWWLWPPLGAAMLTFAIGCQLAAAQRERDELLSRYAFVENQHLCVGYNGKCDGDLEGEPHEEGCPARKRDMVLRPHLYKTPSDQGAAKETSDGGWF